PAPGGGINYVTGPVTVATMAEVAGGQNAFVDALKTTIATEADAPARAAATDVLSNDPAVAQAAADRAVTVASDPAVAGTFAAAGSATRTEADKHYAAAVEIDVTKYATPQAAINAAQTLDVPVVVKFGTGTYTVPATLNV